MMNTAASRPIQFTASITRGVSKGRVLVPFMAEDQFVLLDPAGPHAKKARISDFVYVGTAARARELIETRGYSMRMCFQDGKGGASTIRAARITISGGDESADGGGADTVESNGGPQLVRGHAVGAFRKRRPGDL